MGSGGTGCSKRSNKLLRPATGSGQRGRPASNGVSKRFARRSDPASKALYMQTEYKFSYEVYDDATALSAQDKALLERAHEATRLAYAPYSHFRVGAAARMD